MEKQPTYQSPERRIDATELQDGDEASFRLGNPNHKSIEAARRDVKEATEKLAIKEVISQPRPHEYSRDYSRRLAELRARELNASAGQQPQNERLWSEFEVTR